jgi:flavodoxin
MKALVVYQSKEGTTKKMAEEIASELQHKNVDVKVGSIYDITHQDIDNADRLYVGCWTSGMILFNQGPDKDWMKFASNLPIGTEKKTTLFTTYKVATGSMFKRMRRALSYRGLRISNNALKSKNGNLSPLQKQILSQSLN